MNCIGTYDGTIFYNPANKFCIVSVKTADQSVPAEARSNRRYKDHLIRFTAVGYEIPRTDAVELELDGEWTKGKYGVQLQVEQWREIVPRTKNGVEGYLASGLIKGIGPKTAADIVERFGVDTLDILEHQPERLLEIRGITESKLEDIKASYAENRMLQGIMTLLAPFKITPKTALKIYQYFGPTSVEILEKSPFELCQISGFGFRRVDAIVQKSGGNLHDSMRIKGAVFCALDEGKSKRGHLYISSEELEKSALKLLNEKIPVPELRLHQQEVRDMMQEMILNGAIVSVKDNIYLPRVFAQEDETARRIAQRLVTQMPVEHIAPVLEQVKVEMGLRLSAQQEAAVYAAFRHGLSVITGSPGTGKTTVLRTILEVYRRLHPDGKIALMAPTGRASRRMSESTGFEDARTLHSGLGLTSEEDEGSRNRKSEPLSADLIIVDEFSMVDMWLAEKFFERMKINARIVLVGDPDQLPSVGAGNVFREIIETKIVPVTVLDQIFRQSKDTILDPNDTVSKLGNLTVMGNHHEGLVEFCAGNFQKAQHIAAGHTVQIACWLVRQNDSRLRYQSAGDGYTLLLTAGEIAGHIVQLILQPQHPHHFFHKLLVYLVSVQLHRQHNVFKDIQHRHQIVVLEDEADLSSAEDGKLLIFQCREVAPIHNDLAGSRHIQPADHVQ